MSEQQFTDFFDPEVQKIVSEDGCSIYKMKNVTGEGVITRYEILPGIELFYNDFHMSDGQNQNKLPHSDVLEIIIVGKDALNASLQMEIISMSVLAISPSIV